MMVDCRALYSALLGLILFVPLCAVFAGTDVAGSVVSDFAPQDARSRQISVTNGTPIAAGQYPFVAAVLSGRTVSLSIGRSQTEALFFAAGKQQEFSGPVVECGLAPGPCAGAAGKVCSIVFDFPTAELPALTPAQQLANCSEAGGIAAVFRPNPLGSGILSMAGAVVDIPAVYVYNNDGYQKLFQALSSGSEFNVSVFTQVPDVISCGGTFLGDVWVLTAAHCVSDKSGNQIRTLNPQELLVDVGAHRLGDNTQYVLRVVEIITNNYRTEGPWGKNDYALLRLESVPRRGVALGLATRDQLTSMAAASENALVIGWGSTAVREPLMDLNSFNSTSIVPRIATLKLYSTTACRSLWNDFFIANNLNRNGLDINNNHICAANFELQKDTCQGDSGGPLLVNVDGVLKLAGITSFGLGCGSRNGVPGVYYSSSAFSDWVERTTGLSFFTAADRGFNAPSVDDPPAVVIAGGGGTFLLWPLTGLFFLRSLCARRFRYPLATVACYGIFCLISACGGDQQPSTSAAVPRTDTLKAEKLDAIYSNDVIVARVLSNGCTDVSSFEVSHEKRDDQCLVTLERVTPDFCRRATAVIGLQIEWPLPEGCHAVSVGFANPPLTAD